MSVFWDAKIEKAPKTAALHTTDFMKKVFVALSLFPRKRFQLRHSKIWKNRKISFSNAQNIRFWAQGSFKTIF